MEEPEIKPVPILMNQEIEMEARTRAGVWLSKATIVTCSPSQPQLLRDPQPRPLIATLAWEHKGWTCGNL